MSISSWPFSAGLIAHPGEANASRKTGLAINYRAQSDRCRRLFGGVGITYAGGPNCRALVKPHSLNHFQSMTQDNQMMRLISQGPSPSATGGEPITASLYELGTPPEIYIDGMQGVLAVGPVIKLNCFTRGFNPPSVEGGGTENRFVNARLVMGIDTFVSVVDWLVTIRKDMSINDPNIKALMEHLDKLKAL